MDARMKTFKRMGLWLPLACVVALAMVMLAGCGSAPAAAANTTTAANVATANPTVSKKATATASKKATPTPRPKPARIDGLETVYTFELPREARQTIALIKKGGPFPYERDGITFQNRERLLPNKPRGYYSEYTVITPGSRDRGARRIIAGDRGELYYTEDHYDSFVRVYEP
jgi:ribonuclease T1